MPFPRSPIRRRHRGVSHGAAAGVLCAVVVALVVSAIALGDTPSAPAPPAPPPPPPPPPELTGSVPQLKSIAQLSKNVQHTRSRRPTGKLGVVAGRSRPHGRGPLRTFSIEIERGLGTDRRAVAREVERTLLSPRGWRRTGLSFKRVASGSPSFKVTLASADTTDRLCAPLQTLGRYSCYQGGRAVLNAERWRGGADSYGDALRSYRRYMVNHEVGHALGRGHAGCPARGRRAPLMMQQTKGLDGCRPNPWPEG
ncbi:MAG: DUF3152 domain-containing protein [Thermoleophilaceae bacterium]|jgi:hypothetical protein